jgi:hypothetical protein
MSEPTSAATAQHLVQTAAKTILDDFHQFPLLDGDESRG